MAEFGMSRAGMLTAAVALMALTGCEELTRNTGASSSGGNPNVLRIQEREVEAPEVYSATGPGLWDGRPSLGGIWVAVGEEVAPERVRVTNTENGLIITAALFRQRNLPPGADIQVSSEAAEGLGLEGGIPAILDVVVLRKDTVEIPPVAPAEVVETTPVEERLDAVDEPSVDEEDATTEEVAAETIAALTETPPEAEEAVAEAVLGDPLEEAPMVDAPVEPPAETKKRGFGAALASIFARKPAAAAATTASASAEVAEDATEVLPEAVAIETQALEAAPQQSAAAVLDPVKPVAATPPKPRPAVVAVAAPAAPAEPIAQTNPDGSLVRPFVAVGSFPEQGPASDLILKLESQGIKTKGRRIKDRTGTSFSVFAGPSVTLDDQKALIAKLNSLGYSDVFTSK